MLDYWLWDVVDCMRHEEDKIAGNTRERRELMAQGYIAQTLPKKPKSPLQRYRLLRKGSKIYTEGFDPSV
jgi:hypothetical protein